MAHPEGTPDTSVDASARARTSSVASMTSGMIGNITPIRPAIMSMPVRALNISPNKWVDDPIPDEP